MRPQYHALAASRWLRSRWQSGHWSEHEESLFRKICIDEVEEALYMGRASIMDDISRKTTRAAVALPSYDEHTTAFDYVIDRIVKIPALGCLVRQYRQEGLHKDGETRIIDLIVDIYDAEGAERSQVVQLIQSNIHIIQSTSQHSAMPLRRYFHFESTLAFRLTVAYYMLRTLICGLILRLHDIDFAGVPFDAVDIEAEDLAAADTLIMSSDCAFDTQWLPFKALRMHHPLIAAYGAYDRLFQRCSTRAEHCDAQQMKTLCKDLVYRIFELWRCGTAVADLMDAKAEAFSGGVAVRMPWELAVP